MAYNEQFLVFGKESAFKADLAKSNIKPTSVVFIEESGKEGIYTQGNSYQTIPSNGEDNQVLVSRNGKGVWTDLNVLDLLTYGVEWNPNFLDPTLTRIGNMNYHKTLPIQSGMKGCIYNPKEKKVIYWLDPNDWRYKNSTEKKQYLQGDITFNSAEEAELTVHSTTEIPYGTYINVGDTFFCKIKDVTGGDDTQISYRVTWEDDKIPTPEDIEDVDVFGLAVESNLAGADGEVMVYVPEFYIKSWVETDKRSVRISTIKIDDTWEHQPAVYLAAYKDTILNSVPQNMGYLSTLSVNTAVSVANDQPYCRGGNNDTSTDNYEDVFQRQLGKHRTNLSRASCREYARKAGKEVMSYRQYKNIMYWLWVIEYATFNSQATYTPKLTTEGFRQGGMGEGLTRFNNWTSASYNNRYPVSPNGYTNELGNGTGVKTLTIPAHKDEYGEIQTSPESLSSIRWRGIENPFGDSYHILEGVIIDNTDTTTNVSKVYTTNDPNEYSDSLEHNMTFSGYDIRTSGYTKKFDLGSTSEIIPIELGGNATQYKCDYHYGSTGKTGPLMYIAGGTYNNDYSGLSYLSSYNLASDKQAYYGFRTISVAE